jgi:hypothetical protein
MNQQRKLGSADNSYHYLHLSLEELAQWLCYKKSGRKVMSVKSPPLVQFRLLPQRGRR